MAYSTEEGSDTFDTETGHYFNSFNEASQDYESRRR